MKEEWRDVVGYEGLYKVSCDGRVLGLKRNNILKQHMGWGYLFVRLYRFGKPKTYKVHRLVALAFVKNPKNKPQVNHIDGKKTSNNFKNLEWCTNRENQIHARDNGLLRPQRGESNGFSKLKEFQVKQIIKDYGDKKLSQGSLAKKYGVSQSQVNRILKGKRWSHLKD